MPSVRIKAPAKINLRLKVVGKREDGYHYLSMLNEKLNLADELYIESFGMPEKYSENFPVELICPEDASLQTEANLVAKSARALAKKYDVCAPLKITIRKVTPMGGGLGGGSSDAASTLKALNHLWGLYRSNEELSEIGVTIGADVPFFIWDGPAKVTGIGEGVDPYVVLPKLWILLINPGIHLATKLVYGSLDLKLTQKKVSDSFPSLFNDLDDLAQVIDNDLEKAATKICKEVEQVKAFLTQKGSHFSFMSGSGSTVVGIFESKKQRDLALLGGCDTGWKFFPAENLR